MTISYFVFRYQLLPANKEYNGLDKAQATLALKLNPTSFPKTGCTLFSGVLFLHKQKNIYRKSINESALFKISARYKNSQHK